MGGSGGGSGSGKIKYPDYMEDVHSDWLNKATGDVVSVSVTSSMNTALAGNSPFYSANPADPATDISDMETAVSAFSAFTLAIDPEGDWADYMAAAETQVDLTVNDTALDAEITAHDAIIDDRITTDILPRFQLGMRNINAVVSSAFVIGEAVIESFAQRDKNKFAGDLRLSSYKHRNEMIMAGTKDVLNLVLSKLDYYKTANHYLIESKRIKGVMLAEELTTQMDIDEKDALWDLSVYQYGANVMASIAGGSGMTSSNKPSKAASVMGGALSGAAVGASVGGPYGAAAGAVIGGIGGLLSS